MFPKRRTELITVQILAIAGSLRARSYNRMLVRQAAALRPEGIDWREWDGLAAVPPFNEDDEENPAAGVTALRAAIEGADAVLIATPEYNGSIPGQLKNALDWASRPPRAGVLAGKPVAVVGASRSPRGAVFAQADVRRVLARTGAQVVEGELPIASAHEAFTADGQLHDPRLAEALGAVVDDLVALTEPASTGVA